MLKERDALLNDVKKHLLRAHEIMKTNADKHRRDLEFDVGSLVYLKLRPYRQQSVQKRICQKLAARYYGPYEVLERIGKVAYRLRLPVELKIHPVFHVSQLKPVIGRGERVTPLPPVLSVEEELIVEPLELLDTRYSGDGFLEVLVQWKNLPAHETSWMRMKEFKTQFPSYELEGKLGLRKGGIDMPWRVYITRRKRSLEEEARKRSLEEEALRN